MSEVSGAEHQEDQESKDLTLLKNHAARLREHFDAVQIFVSRHEGKTGTINAQWGEGNWFARYGQRASFSSASALARRPAHRAVK